MRNGIKVFTSWANNYIGLDCIYKSKTVHREDLTLQQAKDLRDKLTNAILEYEECDRFSKVIGGGSLGNVE